MPAVHLKPHLRHLCYVRADIILRNLSERPIHEGIQTYSENRFICTIVVVREIEIIAGLVTEHRFRRWHVWRGIDGWCDLRFSGGDQAEGKQRAGEQRPFVLCRHAGSI